MISGEGDGRSWNEALPGSFLEYYLELALYNPGFQGYAEEEAPLLFHDALVLAADQEGLPALADLAQETACGKVLERWPGCLPGRTWSR